MLGIMQVWVWNTNHTVGDINNIIRQFSLITNEKNILWNNLLKNMADTNSYWARLYKLT